MGRGPPAARAGASRRRTGAVAGSAARGDRARGVPGRARRTSRNVVRRAGRTRGRRRRAGPRRGARCREHESVRLVGPGSRGHGGRGGAARSRESRRGGRADGARLARRPAPRRGRGAAAAPRRGVRMQRRAFGLGEPERGTARPRGRQRADALHPRRARLARRRARGRRFPRARQAVVDGTAHLPTLERPDEVARLVREFLEA